MGSWGIKLEREKFPSPALYVTTSQRPTMQIGLLCPHKSLPLLVQLLK